MSDWLDFNDALVADESAPGLDVDELRHRLQPQLPEYLQSLLPNGRVSGHEFAVGNVAGEAGKSLRVTLGGDSAGLWKDFASDEGGDIFTLTQLVCQLDFQGALEYTAQWLGVTPEPKNSASKRQAPIDELGPETGCWHYHDGEGRLIATVSRYDPPSGKQFRPWDVKARRHKAPDPRPIYNQPGILKSQDVLLVEGEKCAQALIDAGICATTAMNGAKAPVDKTDWTPLKGKQVLVWPDNDQPGREYAESAAMAVLRAGAASCAILIAPSDKPDKWDAADALVEVDQQNNPFDVPGFLAGGGTDPCHLA